MKVGLGERETRKMSCKRNGLHRRNNMYKRRAKRKRWQRQCIEQSKADQIRATIKTAKWTTLNVCRYKILTKSFTCSPLYRFMLVAVIVFCSSSSSSFVLCTTQYLFVLEFQVEFILRCSMRFVYHWSYRIFRYALFAFMCVGVSV